MSNVYEKYNNYTYLPAEPPLPELRALLDVLPPLTRVHLGLGNTLPQGEAGIWRRREVADTYEWEIVGSDLYVITNGTQRSNPMRLSFNYVDQRRGFYYRPRRYDGIGNGPKVGTLAIHHSAGDGTVTSVVVEPGDAPFKIVVSG